MRCIGPATHSRLDLSDHLLGYPLTLPLPSRPTHSPPSLPPSTPPASLQEEMALAGYRTLCIAERELSAEQYSAWHEQYKAASVALVDREMALARVSERIEVDMTLLGATAVEDKLQVRREGGAALCHGEGVGGHDFVGGQVAGEESPALGTPPYPLPCVPPRYPRCPLWCAGVPWVHPPHPPLGLAWCTGGLTPSPP